MKFLYLCIIIFFYQAYLEGGNCMEYCLKEGSICQSRKLIPRTLLFGNPEKNLPQISPNGKLLAYLAPSKDNIMNVWVKSLSKEETPDQKITNECDRGIVFFLWQYDNQHILYLQDRFGDENWQLYQANIFTKETRILTANSKTTIEILHYSEKQPNDLLILMNKREPSLFDVYHLDLKTGKIFLIEENKEKIFKWIVDQNGKVRGSLLYSENGDVIIRVRRDKVWSELIRISQEDLTSCIGFTEDNKKLYFVSSLNGDKAKLITIEINTGKFEILAEDSRYDASTNILINPINKNIEAIIIEKEKQEWLIIDNNITNDLRRLKSQLNGVINICSRDLKNEQWIISVESDINPTTYFLYKRSNQELTFLFEKQANLKHYEFCQMKPVSFQSRDGLSIDGYLTLPFRKNEKKPPAILLVHGGPWLRDTWCFHPMVQWLVNRGIAVLQINFRGSSGYGKAFLNAGNREWGGKMQNDLIDGKKWLIQQDCVDSEKIGIFGASYGGYATLASLAFTPEEFCCGIDLFGPSSLITLANTMPVHWKISFKEKFDKRVGSVEKESDFLKSRSPLYKAKQINKPLLIVQGENDPRVTKIESEQMVNAMKENGIPVKYLLFTNEGHGFGCPKNRLKFFALAENFLSEHLGSICEAQSTENFEFSNTCSNK